VDDVEAVRAAELGAGIVREDALEQGDLRALGSLQARSKCSCSTRAAPRIAAQPLMP
jgi:hypothetical protein